MISQPHGPISARQSRQTPESCLPAHGNSSNMSNERETRSPRVGRRLSGLGQLAKLITRQVRDLDRQHRLQLGERHRFAAPSLLDRLLRPLPGPRNPVEAPRSPPGHACAPPGSRASALSPARGSHSSRLWPLSRSPFLLAEWLALAYRWRVGTSRGCPFLHRSFPYSRSRWSDQALPHPEVGFHQ